MCQGELEEVSESQLLILAIKGVDLAEIEGGGGEEGVQSCREPGATHKGGAEQKVREGEEGEDF